MVCMEKNTFGHTNNGKINNANYGSACNLTVPFYIEIVSFLYRMLSLCFIPYCDIIISEYNLHDISWYKHTNALL
jgi:hypothetical protein